MSRLPAILALGTLVVPSLLAQETKDPAPWSEKLGYPKGKVVLLLHADDIGMCYEANFSAKQHLVQNTLHSASAIVPAPWFNEFAHWSTSHPDLCIGLHIALNSEWEWYRWPPVAHPDDVESLMDPDGYLWSSVPQVMLKAKANEIETEIRAQIMRAHKMGMRPTHIDTHMGTVYARPEFLKAFLKIAREFGLPAMAIEPSDLMVRKFAVQGFVNREVIKILRDYPGPKLDMMWGVSAAKSYEEKLEKFFAMVRDLKPGIHEFYLHPSIETEGLKHITNAWQQRVWEHQMFTDPKVREFLEKGGFLFTSWKEMSRRFQERSEQPNKKPTPGSIKKQ